MSYDPTNQYRCTIIRGKSITKMDDLLPFYAETLSEICPIEEKLFKKDFDVLLSEKLHAGGKTKSNHRTENVDKLLGMIFKNDGIITLSERTEQYLESYDQPLFFKTVCFKFQQPNGGQTINTIKDDIAHNVSYKPYHFVLALLKCAGENQIRLTQNEVGGFCINNLDVMQGKATPQEVLNEILKYRNTGKDLQVGNPQKNRSWNWQHIREQLHYLRFANLIRMTNKEIFLNKNESEVIELFIKDLQKPLHFDIYGHDLDKKESRKQLKQDWNNYYGSLGNVDIDIFSTSLEALSIPKKRRKSTIQLGQEGEEFVLNYEKEIVKSFNPRLVNKVKHQGTTQGLGYDILSIEAGRDSVNPEFTRYIEVKSTKRTTKPDLAQYWDRVNFTRNEWIAASQQEDRFFIYRIYFTAEGVYLAIIKNPVLKNEEKKLYAAPTNYRLEFNDESIDEIIFSEKEEI